MLITDKKHLKKYCKTKRLWQGIPSIEVTNNGRIFLSYFSGGTKEEMGNYVVLEKSDDGGDSFEIVAVVDYGEKARAYDASLWIDPLGRLWLNYAVAPKFVVESIIIEEIDGNLKFNKPRPTVYENMINKPIVYSKDGSWLFPTTVWTTSFKIGNLPFSNRKDRLASVFKTSDQGKTFVKLGGVEPEERGFDEPVLIEYSDHSLGLFTRTHYGVSFSLSNDEGLTFSTPIHSNIAGPDSRFQIRRLKSGNLLLVNHYNFKNRDNLTALISKDNGKTWPYKLLLDERSDVSYPDLKEANDGFIYICYDRERGCFKNKLEDCLNSAREILIAKITEEEIINGKIDNEKSYLKKIAIKLDKYDGDQSNRFLEMDDKEYIKDLVKSKNQDQILANLFSRYSSCLTTLSINDRKELDNLCQQLVDKNNKGDYALLVYLADKIYRFLINVNWEPNEENPDFFIIERARKIIEKNLDRPDLRLEFIAESANISKYYLSHLFRDIIGISLTKYISNQRMKKVIEMLVETDLPITEIGVNVGILDIQYFSKWFKKANGISLKEYRKIHSKK